MAQRFGGKIVTDGLVLCLDAHDAKSYAGEPVTNLVTSSAVDFSVRSTYSGNTFSQVADSESPSGYACEMSYTGTVNSSSRSKFGAATNIPTSGTGFVSIWAKRSAGPSTTMRPSIYTGAYWYILEPLDGGSSYLTGEYRPFGKAVSFGTASGGPNPGFSMTHGGGSTENDKTRWIKPQVTTLSYNTPFANLSRSATNGWVDRSGNSNSGTLVNGADTGISHYREGEVIMPVSASYLDFDGSDDYITISSLLNQETINGSTTKTIILWLKADSYGARMAFSTGQDGNNRIYYWTQYSLNTWRIGNYTSTSGHSTLPSAGTWFCTAIVINGLSVTGYLNGTQDYTGAYSAFTTHEYAVLGRHGTGSYYYDGKIGKVLVYNKALSAAEVLNNYNTAKPRFGL